MVLIRTPPNQRIFVLWNVQAFVDACGKETGATNFGTYMGHSPTAERATDCFTRIPMPRSDRVVGDAIADFALAHWKQYGVRYLIWRQRINWNDGRGWVGMANRGGDTQNHFDHDHISFNVIPVSTKPIPPTIKTGGDVIIVNVQDTGIFLLRGDQVQHFTHTDHVLAFVKAGVPYQDKAAIPLDVFKAYTGWGQARGVMGGAGLEGEDAGADQETAAQYETLVSEVQAGMEAVYDEYVKSLEVPNGS